MNGAPAGGSLSLCVEFQPGVGEISEGRQELALVAELLDAFNTARTPATWTVLRPRYGVDVISADALPHELAIVAPADWAERSVLARALPERSQECQQLGCDLTTLASASEAMLDHHDLLVKHGVRAVRCDEGSAPGPVRSRRWHWFSGSSAAPQPEAVRFGLWRLRPAARLAKAGDFAGCCRAIDGAIRQQAHLAVVIDARRLAPTEPNGQRALNRFLLHIVRRRKEGLLAVETVRQFAFRMSHPRRGTVRAASILRAA